MNLFLVLSFFSFLMADPLIRDLQPHVQGWNLFVAPLFAILPPMFYLLGATVLGKSRCSVASMRTTDGSRAFEFGVMATWYLASMSMIVIGNWGGIVRSLIGDQGASRLSVAVIAPAVVSLILIWLLQFETEESDHRTEGGARSEARVKRFDFIRIRLQVYLVPSLLPLVVLSLCQLPLGAFDSHSLSPQVSASISILILVLVVALMPWLLSICWRTHGLPAGPLRRQLESVAAEQTVTFAEIRIWPTGLRLSNALILGVFARKKLLMLTDRLLELLTPQELIAVVKHEVGHVRLRHLSQRMAIAVGPLVVILLIWIVDPTRVERLEALAKSLGFSATVLCGLVLPSLYAGYIYGILGWLSRQMEKEADLFACQTRGQGEVTANAHNAEILCQALMKVAADSGQSPERETWLHPSVYHRIHFIWRSVRDPWVARRFQRQSRILRTIALIIGCISVAGLLWL